MASGVASSRPNVRNCEAVGLPGRGELTCAPPSTTTSVQDLARFADVFAELADRDVMSGLAVTNWLIEKSALVRLVLSLKADEWAARIGPGWCGSPLSPAWRPVVRPRSGPDLRAGLQRPPLSSSQWNT